MGRRFLNGLNADDLTAGTTALARGGTGQDASGIAKGGLIVGSGAGTAALLAAGTNGQVPVYDSAATYGLSAKWLANPLLTNATFKSVQLLNQTSGDVDIGTPPSGKRWLVVVVNFINFTDTSSVACIPKLKRSGTYYQIGQSVSVNTSNTNQIFDTWPIFESTDTLAVNIGLTGISIQACVIEFETSSPVFSAVNLGLSNGNNTLYTCPSSKHSALFFSNGNAGLQYYGVVNKLIRYLNKSGSNRNVYYNLVKSGGSVVAPGSTSSNALGTTDSGIGDGFAGGSNSNFALFLATGDFVNINTNAGTATQVAWCNVIELPT